MNTLITSRLASLKARFAPHFEKSAAGAAERDRTRALPYQEIADLAAAGFGAVRIPTEYGGDGATLPEHFELFADLAAADSNIAQALRAHFAFVEDRLVAAPGQSRDKWLARFAAGELVGNSWTEVGSVKVGDVITHVTDTHRGPAHHQILFHRFDLRRLVGHLRRIQRHPRHRRGLPPPGRRAA